jgi:branched-subunit amino acid permease
MSTVFPVAALGLGWVGVVIVVLIILYLVRRVF